MSEPVRIGVALPRREERETVVAWLRAAEMEVEVLVEACKVDAGVAGRGFGCVVADGLLLADGYLASLRKQDPRVPIVALADPADATRPIFKRGTSVVIRPVDADTLVLTVSLAHGEGRQARRRPRTLTPRVPSRVSGAPAAIVDISADGVRLEMSRAHAAKLGPQFRLQVPMVALDVVLRRAWVGGGRGDQVVCGAMLVGADAGQKLAWERIMELSGSTLSLAGLHEGDGRAAGVPQAPRLRGRVSQLLASASAVGAWASDQLTRPR